MTIKILKKNSFKDRRGLLWTTWKKGEFNPINFNHDKFSYSKKKVLRGLHCDFKSWKMITSVYGRFLLVVVNMKKNSKNYLKHKKWIIDHKKPTLILIPNCRCRYIRLMLVVNCVAQLVASHSLHSPAELETFAPHLLQDKKLPSGDVTMM